MDRMIALSFFPFPFLAGLLVLVAVLLVLRHAKRPPAYLFVFSVFWLYLMMVAALTIFPLFLPLEGESRRSVGEIMARVNLVPFHQMPGGRLPFRLRGEMVANILMTIPFGLLFPLLARVKPWLFPIIALGIGMAIELTQLTMNLYSGNTFRVTDINDVIFNFTGAIIGYGIYLILRGAVWLARRLAK